MASASVYDRPLEGSRFGLIALIIAVLGIALGLRLFGLTIHSLWFDEGYSIGLSGQENLAAFFSTLRDGGPGQLTQPLYFFILFFWQKVAGDSDTALRLLSALIGFGAVVVLFITARRAFGDRHALWAAAFAGMSSFSVYYSQEVRPYALMILLTTLLLWAYTEATLAPRLKPRHLLALTATAVLMMLGSVISMFVLATVALADLAAWRRPGRWFITWLPAGIGSAVVMVGYWLVWPSTNTVQGAPDPLLNLAYVPFGLIVGQTFGPSLDTLRGADKVAVVAQLWPRFVLLGIVVLAVAWRLRHLVIGGDKTGASLTQRRIAQAFALMLGGSYVVGAVLMFGLNFEWLPRRASYMLPMIALVVPLAVPMKGALVVRIAPIAGLIALNLFSLWIYFTDPAHRRDEYREAVAYITESAAPDSVTILAWGQPELTVHYGGGDIVPGRSAVRGDDFLGEIQRLAGDHDVVRLMINREWNFNTNFARRNSGSMLETMDQAYELVGLEEFVAVKVYTFERKNPS
ncbi:MAG: glycosyltransferase family 39 protein [Alphaproteobacteria bacterium]